MNTHIHILSLSLSVMFLHARIQYTIHKTGHGIQPHKRLIVRWTGSTANMTFFIECLKSSGQASIQIFDAFFSLVTFFRCHRRYESASHEIFCRLWIATQKFWANRTRISATQMVIYIFFSSFIWKHAHRIYAHPTLTHRHTQTHTKSIIRQSHAIFGKTQIMTNALFFVHRNHWMYWLLLLLLRRKYENKNMLPQWWWWRWWWLGVHKDPKHFKWKCLYWKKTERKLYAHWREALGGEPKKSGRARERGREGERYCCAWIDRKIKKTMSSLKWNEMKI